MSYHVALRYLLAREQLGQSLDLIERLIKEEKWREARDAMQLFARKLGVGMSGIADPEIRIHTEWLSALDHADQNVFLSFVGLLRPIAEVVWPRAVGGPAPDFEIMRLEALFRNLKHETHAIEDMMRGEEDAYKHGRFMIIPMKGVTDTAEAVKTLDEASGHISTKFGQVLYGKVYVRKDLRPKGSFDPRPGSGGMIAGAYQGASDTITLSMYATPERNSVMTLIHEFGHRYHTRFLHGDKREEFIRLSTVGDVHEEFFPLGERERFGGEFVQRHIKFRDDETFGAEGPVHLSERAEFYFKNFPRDEWKAKVSPLLRRLSDNDEDVIPALVKGLARAQYGGNLRVVDDEENLSPISASLYGETSWEENFAESFLAFCTGKALPPPLHKFMASL